MVSVFNFWTSSQCHLHTQLFREQKCQQNDHSLLKYLFDIIHVSCKQIKADLKYFQAKIHV